MFKSTDIKVKALFSFLVLSLCFFSCKKEKTPLPDFLYGSSETMDRIKNDYKSGSQQAINIVNKVKDCADQNLNFKEVSVMDKGVIPPSGDKHDYISQGPYWWPDTTKSDGLPYIRRDGVVNPEREKFSDRKNLSALLSACDKLSRAYFFTENVKYATKAVQLLKVWFVDDATKMNPNLEFGQGIPGRTEGRGIGIIETSGIGKLADIVSVLRSSIAWNVEMEDGMISWTKGYLNWLTTSEKGLDESVHPNNHGTWYDVQTMSLAIFTGQNDLARSIAEKAKKVRFDDHIMSDGSQPRELSRTKSFNYSTMNLKGLFMLAGLANKVGVDLWHYENANGATLEDGLNFILPVALGKAEWTYDQISPIHPEGLRFHTKLASKIYDSKYDSAFNQLKNLEDQVCPSINELFY